MMLRGGTGTLTKLLQSSLQYSSLRSRLRAANISKRCISSLGSGFDGSSFSDDEDNYEEIRTNHRGYGEPGSVTLRADQDANIDEFNKEFDAVFGAAPLSQRATNSQPRVDINQVSPQIPPEFGATIMDKENAFYSAAPNFKAVDSPKETELLSSALTNSHSGERFGENTHTLPSGLSHVDSSGKAAMVNVAEKKVTNRMAIASGHVLLGRHAFTLVAANNISKGDVLTVAKISGITGAKQTGNLIPLCHNLLLSGVDLSLVLNEASHAVDIEAKVTTVGPTGVEMEALTAVAIASLTVYDMCKAVSKEIRICNIQLDFKTGGKSGNWSRPKS